MATIAALLSTSAAMTTTDLQANAAMGALHVAFNQYMQACIDATNNGNVPFILPYRIGQGKVIILFFAIGLACVIIYCYIKLLIKVYRAGLKFRRAQIVRYQASKLVDLAHQNLGVSLIN